MNFINERKCSKARLLLVCVWLLAGFLLTISYKSVLRSMMMTVEYEKTIDNLEDMIMSKLRAVVPLDNV